jgi:cyclase
MSNVRLIARLDIKGQNLIKGIRFEGLRVLGDPQQVARRYYENGIDELIYIDTVASLYGRNCLYDIVEYSTNNIFIPFTVGGGLCSVNDVKKVLRAGAEKVAINTAAVRRPELIDEISKIFGSQCLVLSVQAKRRNNKSWEAFIENGREPTGLSVVEWVQKGEEMGAGEILLTSVDQDGTLNGFDVELIDAVVENVTIPVIACGGAGSPEDIIELVKKTNVDAVAMASLLHYNYFSIDEIRNDMSNHDIEVRSIENILYENTP